MLVAAGLVLLVLAGSAIAVWIRYADDGDVIASDRHNHYYSPVWMSGDWVYFLADGYDSESRPGLVRVHSGRGVAPIDVAVPKCGGDVENVQDLFQLDTHTLGMVVPCRGVTSDNISSDTGVDLTSALVSFDVDTHAVNVLSIFRYDGGSVAWNSGNNKGYRASGQCSGIAEFDDSNTTCIEHQGGTLPVVGSGGSVLFVSHACAEQVPQSPDARFLCIFRPSSRAFELQCGQAANIRDVATASTGSIAFVGTVGKQDGAWIVTAGTATLVTAGAFDSLAFSPDGRRIVVSRTRDGLFSKTSDLVVVDAGVG